MRCSLAGFFVGIATQPPLTQDDAVPKPLGHPSPTVVPWGGVGGKRSSAGRIATVSPPQHALALNLVSARRRRGCLCRIAVSTAAPPAGATGNAAAMAGTAAAGGRLWAGQFSSLWATCSNTTNSAASSRWCAWPMGMPLPNGLPLGWLSTPQRCRAVHRWLRSCTYAQQC